MGKLSLSLLSSELKYPSAAAANFFVAAASSRSESTLFMLALIFSMLGSIRAAFVLSAQYLLLAGPGGEAEDCFFLAESKPQTERDVVRPGESRESKLEQSITVVCVVQHWLQNPSTGINKPVVHLVRRGEWGDRKNSDPRQENRTEQ